MKYEILQTEYDCLKNESEHMRLSVDESKKQKETFENKYIEIDAKLRSTLDELQEFKQESVGFKEILKER